jgi:GNAT superfamily N-acetyltransferase
VTDPPIRRGTRDDASRIAELIARAFLPLPPVAWLIPDPVARLRIMTANFRIYVDHAVEHGLIDLNDGGRAAAVWFPRTAPLPAPADYERRLAAACDPWTERFRQLDALFDEHHPTAPHHHLALLAVHPDTQGHGLGSVLLRHHHTMLDAAGTPAYLEASSERSRDVYLQHGYQSWEPFTLPDGTPFWPMWRDPQ